MNQPSLEKELEELLGEHLANVAEHERSAFDRLAGPLSEQIVIFGAGKLGRKTLAGLRRQGIEPLAISDNSAALWHRPVEGLCVLPPKEAAERFGQRAVFVVAIWGAGHRHRQAQTCLQLAALGCTRVVNFGYLFWKYPDVFLPHYGVDLPHKICSQYEEVRNAFALWADEASRQEYLAQVRWRMHLDFDGLPRPVSCPQYFPPDLFSVLDDEVFIDCGAFNGDTIKALLEVRKGRFKGIVALEPDPANFDALRRYVGGLAENLRRRILLHPLAAAAHTGTLTFDACGTASSGMSALGTLMVDCVALDELLVGVHPTYLKMDIEGGEINALRGARDLIRRTRPVLAISAYHLQDHLWQVPLLIRSFCDDYAYYLRPHDEENWDLVCYAVPAHRFNPQSAHTT